MGIGDDNTAASRLRLLQAEFTQPGQTREPGTRTAPTAVPSAPLNLRVVDHMRDAIAEVVALTRAAVPAASPDALPLPEDAAYIYAWAREQTAHLPEERQDVRRQVEYRQSLEHAILMGDHDVVCKHPCPACGCFGLQWASARRKAACLNLACTDENGVGRAWSLSRLAREQIAAGKKLNRQAT